jgi:beta-galactosidase beta subunit
MALLGRVEELMRPVRSDAHAPCLRVNETDGLVRKLVIKIKDAETVDPD